MIIRNMEDNLEDKGKKSLFVYDIITSHRSIYPLDLDAGKILRDTMAMFKGEGKDYPLKEILCKSHYSHDLFINLFWLYFYLQFHKQSYLDLRTIYKQKIKQNYAELFYTSTKSTGLRKVPFIYSWAIIRKAFITFKRSVAEFNKKFVIKCCQIVIFELQGLSVSELFIIEELNSLINDPLLFEIIPE